MDSPGSDEGLLEGKIIALTKKDTRDLPFNRLQFMHLMTMITDDVITRWVGRVHGLHHRGTPCRFEQTFHGVAEGGWLFAGRFTSQ